jgi:hypothetical protein
VHSTPVDQLERFWQRYASEDGRSAIRNVSTIPFADNTALHIRKQSQTVYHGHAQGRLNRYEGAVRGEYQQRAYKSCASIAEGADV